MAQPAKSGRPASTDAVVVVPGIMGSELVDSEGRVVWGLKPSVLASAWITQQIDVLHVTEDDLAGKRRLHATRLLRSPSFIPFLGGMEPYTALIKRISDTVVDSRAVAEFAYDWRLSIEFNASELVKTCEEHLENWRKIVTTERYGDPSEVRLVLVAHSMGGLVSRVAASAPGVPDALRAIVTLGTPYFGAVKAVRTMETGEGTPVPKQAARSLAITCPGLYDLLPRYLCVHDSDAPKGLRALSVDDVISIGGDGGLAEEAAARWTRLGLNPDAAARPGPVPIALVGAGQPTLEAVAIADGQCQFMDSIDGVNHGGDSTVYRRSAAPIGVTASPLPQKHSALAKSTEALTFVVDKLTGADTGPPLGDGGLGADIPDVVDAGQRVSVRVTGAEGDPAGAGVSSIDLDTGQRTTWKDVRSDRASGDLHYSCNGLRPGLHRIEVKGGGFSAISDITLVMSNE
jgi:Lecithin:cholesterol acyltransferase